jgi:hypothetical protein
MWWYIGIIVSVYLAFWVIGGFLQLMKERERKDPEYVKKMDKHRKKWIPKFDKLENIFVWCFGLAIIFAFIYFQ